MAYTVVSILSYTYFKPHLANLSSSKIDLFNTHSFNIGACICEQNTQFFSPLCKTWDDCDYCGIRSPKLRPKKKRQQKSFHIKVEGQQIRPTSTYVFEGYFATASHSFGIQISCFFCLLRVIYNFQAGRKTLGATVSELSTSMS
jgi:hypothetical protein